MEIRYPIDYQIDEKARSPSETKESAIASREMGNIVDGTKSIRRSEGLTYLWKGDRECSSDGFEFEFKRE